MHRGHITGMLGGESKRLSSEPLSSKRSIKSTHHATLELSVTKSLLYCHCQISFTGTYFKSGFVCGQQSNAIAVLLPILPSRLSSLLLPLPTMLQGSHALTNKLFFKIALVSGLPILSKSKISLRSLTSISYLSLTTGNDSSYNWS